MISPAKGILLIANPFLKDPNFSRTVIFICENVMEGTFGFVLNKQFPKNLKELLPDLDMPPLPVYVGGPVQPDSLHFVHQYPDLISGGEEVFDGVYWGGNFESLQIHLKNNSISPDKIRFFIAYSAAYDNRSRHPCHRPPSACCSPACSPRAAPSPPTRLRSPPPGAGWKRSR